MRGTVKFFNEDKGYGFIKADDSKEDYFVHATNVKAEDKLDKGTKVEFEVGEGKRGPQAVEVTTVQ